MRKSSSQDVACVALVSFFAQMEQAVLPKIYGPICEILATCKVTNDCAHGHVCNSGFCHIIAESASLMQTAVAACVSFAVSGFALSAGVGGGGLYVPLLIGVMAMDAKAATAVSQAMLAGGALAAMGSNVSQSHPLDKRQPLIDFDLALLLGPCLMAGAQIGSMLNAASPSWLILILLLVVLADSSQKAIKKGLQLRGKEKSRAQHTGSSTEFGCAAVIGQSCGADKEMITKGEQSNPGVDEVVIPWRQLLPWPKVWGLVGVWILQCVIIAVKGGKGVPSIFGIRHCGAAFWLITALSVFAQLAVGGSVARQIEVATTVEGEGLKVEAMGAWRLLTWSVLAGVIASMCGIGGGMVMGPILLEIGIDPQVSAATTASTLLILSSSTALALLTQGSAPVEQALGFGFATFVGSAVGKTLITGWVKRSGRSSLIVFILAGILVTSAILLSWLGVRNVWTSIATGKGLGFSNPCSVGVEGHGGGC